MWSPALRIVLLGTASHFLTELFISVSLKVRDMQMETVRFLKQYSILLKDGKDACEVCYHLSLEKLSFTYKC